MKLAVAFLFSAFALGAIPAAASDALVGPGLMCATPSMQLLGDDLSGIWSPCTVRPGAVLFEATYLQNASAVGGTALAAYPMLDVRTGIIRRVDFVFHVPSQIAESGLGGIGLYPTTHVGYGLRYNFLQTGRSALAVLGEVLPPTSRFAPSHGQAKYLLGFTSDFAVRPKLTLGFSAAGLSSGTVGFERILPSLAVRAAYDTTRTTQISADLGTRLVSRRVVAQSFGDIAVNQSLRKNLVFNVGLGTTFNSVANAKAHYLASGFNYRI